MSNRPRHFVLLMLALALGGTPAAHADESLFGYVKGADTQPKGQGEGTFAVTHRGDKKVGSYNAYDLVAEVEYGVTDRFSVGAAIGAFALKYDDRAFAPELDEFGVPGDPTPAYSDFHLSQLKLDLKYRFLSPYTDGIGLALYTEGYYQWYYGRVDGANTRQISLEPRLVLQKNYLDDTLVFGMNLPVEIEWRCFEGANGNNYAECENEFKFEPSVGASYRFMSNVSGGVEYLFRTDVLNGKYNHGSHFFGPNIHIGAKRWYATATFLFQVAGNPAYSYDAPAQYARHDINLEEETVREFRLKVGLNF